MGTRGGGEVCAGMTSPYFVPDAASPFCLVLTPGGTGRRPGRQPWRRTSERERRKSRNAQQTVACVLCVKGWGCGDASCVSEEVVEVRPRRGSPASAACLKDRFSCGAVGRQGISPTCAWASGVGYTRQNTQKMCQRKQQAKEEEGKGGFVACLHGTPS